MEVPAKLQKNKTVNLSLKLLLTKMEIKIKAPSKPDKPNPKHPIISNQLKMLRLWSAKEKIEPFRKLRK